MARASRPRTRIAPLEALAKTRVLRGAACDRSVLSGELEFLDGARTFIARTGGLVFIPRGIRHWFRNTGVHAVRLLLLFTQGGDEQGFDLLDEAKPGQPPPAWRPQSVASPELARFWDEAGIEFLPE
jgi:hypothetical protein